ncbi:hypothetical protein Dsin_030065 [Dipteronia sinensis]|uniref:GTP cyclohydrolase 1 n=1 Tax=Dipteronia sinensis TaxID=43782 RepID=A0AAE0DQU9_9ROSI|nr:hypothetical protein Dsin_030065 [Dipteronia sinensis]
MGALDEGHFHEELSNGVKQCCSLELGFEQEPETLTIQDAVRLLLTGLSEDFNREGLKKTPLRVAKALRHGTRGYRLKVKDIVEGALFHEAGLDDGNGHAGGADEPVIVRDLDLFSYCESCLLPFQVKCHVGYVPSGERVLGLSKLSRVADIFAKRLQDPKRLGDEVCSALYHGIKPVGVAVVLQCLHLHVPNLESAFLDPNHQGWVKTLVRSGSGIFENENADAWDDFAVHLRFKGIDVHRIHIKDSTDRCWCPSRSSSIPKISCMLESANQELVATVASIIRSLGEDPSRKELVGTPSRYVKWLMNFQNTNLEMKLNDFPCGRLDLLKPSGEVSHNKEQMHSELNLSFWSLCEHHLLPFHGVVHIGYFSAEGINSVGKSLLQSIVHFYGFKLQLQERLTKQITHTATSLLGGDVMVVVEASHYCMISRGIEKLGSSTVTCKKLGRFKSDPAVKDMFLQTIPNTKLEG